MWTKIKQFFVGHNKIRKTLKFFLWLLGILVASFVLTFAALQVSCRPQGNQQVSTNYPSPVPQQHLRPEVSTYLTYPEWFIVYSSDEYANYLSTNKPSGFPYFGSVNQYWSNYCKVYAITKSRNEFSAGDHLMLFVIGWSYSAELSIKGVYENTVGRVTELFGHYPATAEDLYADKVDKDYVDFIRLRPWYEYNFARALKNLWTQTPFFGHDFVRKIERRTFFTVEYSVKTVYGYLIGLGSHAVYGWEDTETYAVIKTPAASIFQKHPEMKEISKLDNGTTIISIPRYQPFTDLVPVLAKEGVKFIDITGDREIFLTALVNRDLNYKPSQGQVVFETNILTNPKQKRIAISVPVENLSQTLVELQNLGGSIEHIYDY